VVEKIADPNTQSSAVMQLAPFEYMRCGFGPSSKDIIAITKSLYFKGLYDLNSVLDYETISINKSDYFTFPQNSQEFN